MDILYENYGVQKVTMVNPDDFNWDDEGEHFWKHDYIINFEGALYLVNANNEQSAFDELIDWAQKNAPGYLLDGEYILELRMDAVKDGHDEDAYVDEYIYGGNTGRYLSSMNVTIKQYD